jgi:putative PIN family toxin of toxin-antitoxin system
VILAVLDTNVLVSALLSPYGPSRYIFEFWRQGKFELVTSLPCLAELDDVLHRSHIKGKYGLSENDIDRYALLLATGGTVIAVPEDPEPMCQDPDDDKFLVCALLGKADVVVSGDSDLLLVNGIAGIAVVTPRDFAVAFLGGWQPILPGIV